MEVVVKSTNILLYAGLRSSSIDSQMLKWNLTR